MSKQVTLSPGAQSDLAREVEKRVWENLKVGGLPGWISEATHDARVAELLAANNREVERRRAAENEVKELREELRTRDLEYRADAERVEWARESD